MGWQQVPTKFGVVWLSECCNAINERKYSRCSYCNEFSYHKKVPKFHQLTKGVWRIVGYKLKTRHVLIEKLKKLGLEEF